MNAYAKEARLRHSGGFFSAFAAALKLAGGVASERRRLEELTDRELRDIGLSREEALTEASRTVWDLPRRK